MIFEEEKIAGVDKNPIEVERVLVIILGVVCLLIPFLVT